MFVWFLYVKILYIYIKHYHHHSIDFFYPSDTICVLVEYFQLKFLNSFFVIASDNDNPIIVFQRTDVLSSYDTNAHPFKMSV